MANEELNQRGYLTTGSLKGNAFGPFEELDIGATTVRELVATGVQALVPMSVAFPFAEFKPPKKPESAKPDRVLLRRINGDLHPEAVCEWKAPTKFNTDKLRTSATEQALYNGAALGVPVGVATDGRTYIYIDIEQSLLNGSIEYFPETRDFGPGVLDDLLSGAAGVAKDPKPLAERVWQIIWHATKAEPRDCLLTFVEIFVLKFLSDNLPKRELPDAQRFYELTQDPAVFNSRYGQTAIEYYITQIRPKIKTLFPDNVLAKDPAIAGLFGLGTVVSKTSVINGFAFLASGTGGVASYNRVFLEILDAFQTFGPLSSIDPEFKLRLYETFLKRSARQQRLGQFFTPRNIVQPMIRMAQLDKLPAGSVVLDPAAGVGGFILEPLIVPRALEGSYVFAAGTYKRTVTLAGVDVDADLHILAKANMLLHLAEQLRDPATTMSALNDAMADTFVLMNHNQTLGSLEYPPIRNVDVVLTNPPYVTEGSGVYRDEVKTAQTTPDGKKLADFYEGSGLGLEGMFMRLIVEALKPGGRAFVVVPMGFLNRTSVGPKQRILDECNLLCSIALPRSAFFNTAQPAYVLGLERRHTPVDPRPDVLCGMARTIGETLDWERVPTPSEHDLEEIAEAFVELDAGSPGRARAAGFIKLIPATDFEASDRWDVVRFWNDDELVKLGQKPAAVTRTDFIDEAEATLETIMADFDDAKQELAHLQTISTTRAFTLSDATRFSVRSGTRITGAQVRDNPGQVPVYSCFTNPRQTKGSIDAAWLAGEGIAVEHDRVVTVMANGAKAVGKVFVREPEPSHGYVVTDDVIIVEPIAHGGAPSDTDIDYLAVALRSAIAAGGFFYEAKLFVTRVLELEVEVPVDASGNPDLDRQLQIAEAVKRFDSIRERLAELGSWSSEARIR